jgi:hypothetical protein
VEWSDNEHQNAKCRMQRLWLTVYDSMPSESQGPHQFKITSVPTTSVATWRAQCQRELIGLNLFPSEFIALGLSQLNSIRTNSIEADDYDRYLSSPTHSAIVDTFSL